MRNSYTVLSENLKRRDHFAGLSVDGRIILKWILEKEGVRLWNGFNWLRMGAIICFIDIVINLRVPQKQVNF
jgi:hypothetical protein